MPLLCVVCGQEEWVQCALPGARYLRASLTIKKYSRCSARQSRYGEGGEAIVCKAPYCTLPLNLPFPCYCDVAQAGSYFAPSIIAIVIMVFL
jgi:hypothetical protein